MARGAGALVVAIVTEPFGCEGGYRAEVARRALLELQAAAASILARTLARVLASVLARILASILASILVTYTNVGAFSSEWSLDTPAKGSRRRRCVPGLCVAMLYCAV